MNDNIYNNLSDLNPKDLSNLVHENLSSYEICGNCLLGEAEVILITDVTNPEKDNKKNITDVTNPEKDNKKNASLIDKIWNNHLILVEYTARDVQILPNWNPLTRGIESNVVIKGWDLEGLEKKFKLLDHNGMKIEQQGMELKMMLQNGEFEGFLKENQIFDQFIEAASQEIKKEKKELRHLLNNAPWPHYKERLYFAIERTIYQHMTQKKVVEYKENFLKRQESLKIAIEEGLQSHKKVIVCLNANHVLPNPNLKGKDYDLTSIWNYLQSKNYVLIHHKNSPLSLPQDQTLLWNTKTTPISIQMNEPAEIKHEKGSLKRESGEARSREEINSLEIKPQKRKGLSATQRLSKLSQEEKSKMLELLDQFRKEHI